MGPKRGQRGMEISPEGAFNVKFELVLDAVLEPPRGPKRARAAAGGGTTELAWGEGGAKALKGVPDKMSYGTPLGPVGGRILEACALPPTPEQARFCGDVSCHIGVSRDRLGGQLRAFGAILGPILRRSGRPFGDLGAVLESLTSGRLGASRSNLGVILERLGSFVGPFSR